MNRFSTQYQPTNPFLAQSAVYRYGFNGMERDPEHNSGAYDFGARILDTGLGRWMSVDPDFKKSPENGNFDYAVNNPIYLIDHEGRYPIKPEVIGVKQMIHVLKANQVKDLTTLMTYFGGLNNSHASAPEPNSPSQGRYLFSGTNGWLDMRHLAASALATDTWYITGEAVLEKGEENEKSQEINEPSSAWSYEDLVSNKLGVEFEAYLEENEGEFLEVLELFLTEECGFVDNPLDVAPNAAELPERYPIHKNTPPVATNRTYTPMYTMDKETKTQPENSQLEPER